ncbi:hypothetical protein HN51_016920 [Arachis hypogaea]|uniref:Protein kinase domain-containing protein n=2 Tax=Arachis TaxID=3817 RepID=A0A445CV72_ARAHY|nr:probable inactive receptor kinase At4g23740 [Arachis hypogaea]XP_025606345.1 probable inactive receptor kinase At4g23740 [Arachis hypogaea]XP_025606347.1 probable inactive receptor kinase At4g23740 [Arachis hypogaea]QHO47555.1 putative inactive receptor kinase [Arachis hypogaea]RYR54832.1 hypothetical protein Ahy_A06g030096 [Arachis hypogaea]
MSMKLSLFIFAFMIIGAMFFGAEAELLEDEQALLDFFHKIDHSKHLNWGYKTSLCKSWTGVTCDSHQSRVVGLRLPRAGLIGPIPSNTLSRLSALQTLNLESNSITGPLPLDFSVWKNLTIADFSNNSFIGSIPSSISKLTHLNSLDLSNNSLSGEIPDLKVPSLKELNLANNNLSGIVPKSLQRFPSWVFSGNKLNLDLTLNHTSEYASANSPLQQPNNSHPTRKNKRLSEPALLGIIIAVSLVGFAAIASFAIVLCYKKGNGGGGGQSVMKSHKTEFSSKTEASLSRDRNKIIFFEGCNLAFDLEDLLRASAEVLGKGTFGTVYKAAIEDATTVAVKRLKEVTVGKREFEQQMEVVGRIRHDNLAALRAYYYSKEEKLMVYDYYEQGSVSSMLHGKRGEGRVLLDWESRLRIAMGTARGIAHIHAQNGGKLIHGNIKSSNIFLNSQGYGCISDTGLATLISPIPPAALRAAGYRAPEVTDTRKATVAADVYSFGVLLLELLTRRSPMHATGGEEVVHLVRWVNSVVREEWTAEVFDVELLKYPNIEEEMVEMLQLGLACVARVPDKRPTMVEVVKVVEEIRLHSGNRPSSESRSEGSSTPNRGHASTSIITE